MHGVIAGRTPMLVSLGVAVALFLPGYARAHTDGSTRAAVCLSESCTVRFIVQPTPNNAPMSSPPRLGGIVQWKVTTNFTGTSPCGLNINVGAAVTGANQQNASVIHSSSGYWTVVYSGNKAGRDHVKITIAVSGCTGSDYKVKINGYDPPFETDVGWGGDWRHNGTCDSPWAPAMSAPAFRHRYRAACVDDPIGEGQGDFQRGVTDLRLRAPGIPFELTRVYNSLDGSVASELGQDWRIPYASYLSLKTNTTPNTATAILGTGQRIVFTKSGTAWIPDSWTTAKLTYASNIYTMTQGDQTRWTFDTAGALRSLVDRNGVGLTVAGGANHPVSVTTSNGKVVTFTWTWVTGCTATPRLTKVSLPDGRSVSYGYDSTCHLATVSDPRGGVTGYTYDSDGRLLTVIDPRGNVTVTNTYDAWNHVATQTDALGNVTSYSWYPAAFVAYGYYESDAGYGMAPAPPWGADVRSFTRDARGNTWIDGYTADGLITGQRDPLRNDTSYGYDANGLPTTTTDPLGSTIENTFDAAQNVIGVTAPGTSTATTYDARSNPLSVTDGRNDTTSYAYDANGNLLTTTAPDNTTTTLTYNGSGQVLTATDERGKTTTYAYDASGYLASKTTPTGAKTTYGFDGSGRLTSIVDPRGNATGAVPNDYKTTYAYDAADNVTSITDPLGHTETFTYDPNGNLTSKTDANNHTWGYAYDADNRLTTVTAPDLSTTTYAYDAVGNLASRTDAKGHTTVYTYDAANRLIGKTDPLNRQWVYGYDAASNLVSVTTPSGGTITYGYDALGRRTSITYSDGTPSVAFGYDANGNRTSMTDGTGTAWSYSYDQRDRLTGATHGSDSFSYTYDLAGNIATRTYPDATVTSYGYDDDGRLTSATSGTAVTGYQYDPAAELTQTTLPNGVVETASYDRAGRVSQRNDGFRTFVYGYDAAGNVTSRTIGSGATSYGYDSLDRLTSVTGPATSISYSYDGVGNRIGSVDSSGSTTFGYDAGDELTSTSGPGGTTSYGYDANGNETSAGAWTFSFNLADQLTGATDGTSGVAYGYDGDGNRVSSTTGGVTTGLVWDSSFALPQLALERDASGGLVRRYSYGVGRISLTNATTTAYYSSDPLGTVTDLSGSTGTNLGAYDSNPFGDGLATTGVAPSVQDNPFIYTGEYRDPMTGLYNLRARQYDTAAGRFLSLDPLAPQDYSDPYGYVANNPLGFTDPSGMRRTPAGSPNGCGPGGPGLGFATLRYAGRLVSRYAGPWNFDAACDFHDACYAKWDSIKYGCDLNFLSRMNDACPAAGISLVGWPACQNDAWILYQFVRSDKARDHYDAMQLKACPSSDVAWCRWELQHRDR